MRHIRKLSLLPKRSAEVETSVWLECIAELLEAFQVIYDEKYSTTTS
jgi:hypothetical protein